MANIPYVDVRGREISDDTTIDKRYLRHFVWFNDDVLYGKDPEADDFEPSAALQGYIGSHETLPTYSNYSGMIHQSDNERNVTTWVSEAAWDRLDKRRKMVVEFGGTLSLLPLVASRRCVTDNITSDVSDNFNQGDAKYEVGAIWQTTESSESDKLSYSASSEGSFVDFHPANNTTGSSMYCDIDATIYPQAPAITYETHSAIMLLIRVTPNREPTATVTEVRDNRWKAVVEFGDVEITMVENEKVTVKVGDTVSKLPVQADVFKEGSRLSKRMPDAFQFYIRRIFNGILISSGVPESDSQDSGFVYFCPKKEKYDWGTFWNGIDIYDSSKMSDYEDDGILISDSLTYKVDFGSRLTVTLYHARAQVQFIPVVFFGRGTQVTYLQKIEPTTADTDSHTLYLSRIKVLPIWYHNYSGCGINILKSIVTDTDGDHYLKIELIINDDLSHSIRLLSSDSTDEIIDQTEARNGTPQIWGLMIIKEADGYRPFRADTGIYNMTSSMESRITSVEVSCGLDGISGSISIDGRNLTLPDYSIGGMEIKAYGGYNTVDSDYYNVLAKMIGMGYQVQLGQYGERNVTIPLVGRDEVLNDIKPGMYDFYDGMYNSRVVSEIAWASKMIMYYQHGSSTLYMQGRLPGSTDPLQSPMINFEAGTSIKDAITRIAELDGHRFFVDIDGKGWYVAITNNDGLYVAKPVTWTYAWADVMSAGWAPIFDDLRTKILVVGMPAFYDADQNNPGIDPKKSDKQPRPVILSAELTNGQWYVNGAFFMFGTLTPSLSWDRSMVEVFPGDLSKNKLSSMLKDRCRQASTVYDDSTVTIPGNSQIRLLDLFKDGDSNTFVITNIQQSVNTESKEWTTTLGLQDSDRGFITGI